MIDTAPKLRRARKEYHCTERSYHLIHPGDLYLFCTLPPWHEMNQTRKSDPGGRRWLVIRACLRCANEYAMHTSDTRKQLEALKGAAEPHHEPTTQVNP